MGKQRQRRAIGIIRVSEQGGRDDDSFMSPDDQRGKIEAYCQGEDWRLLDVLAEIDVSGAAPLARRKGLRSAVEAVEAGQADVIVVAYFDRLVRSIKVQTEVVERVEAAGGDVLTMDFGQLTNGNAAQRLTSNFMGAVAQYYRESGREKSMAGQELALKKGHLIGILIPGLRRDGAGQAELDPITAPVVAEAFRLRADGATVAVVRAHLAANGIDHGHPGVGKLLRNRQAVGEYRFGDFTASIPALIDRATFDRVQRMSVPAGRRAKSERLLARLGILRCGTCGSRMVLGTQTHNGRSYHFYRCGAVRADCAARPAIAAEIAERAVVAEVKRLLAGITETASAENSVREAAAALDHAQAILDAAYRGFDTTEPAALERLRELRDARDAARDLHEQLADRSSAMTIAVGVGDWDDLSRDARRKLIRAVIVQVTVAPGRGADRIKIEPRS
jgi:site-specific DNA recombinase